MKIRYLVFVPYLIFIGVMGGNVLVDALVIGLALAMYDILFPAFFLSHPIHLQHNHETNMTEGAVHARCNAVLWQYEGR